MMNFWHRPHIQTSFSQMLSLSMTFGLMLACFFLICFIRLETMPFGWNLQTSKWELPQAHIDLFIDSEHVLYVGRQKQITYLERLEEVLQKEALLEGATDVIHLHIQPGVDSTLLLSILSQLEKGAWKIYFSQEK